MVTVHFLPANRSITVASGTTILEAARLAGILIESPCNGAVVCGKCTVHLDPDSLHKVVRKGIHHLSRREERAGQVLSCEAEVVGDITVSVPAAQDDRSLKITSHGHAVAVTLAPYVIKEYLAERGRQYATVKPEVKQIPPSSLEVTFNVVEGPKVKVGVIDITGNQVYNDRWVISSMKNLRPIGIPHSRFFENLFAKTYDASKLEEDKERIRNFYQERGYFTARTLDHTVKMRDVGGGWFRVPLFYPNRPGKRADRGSRGRVQGQEPGRGRAGVGPWFVSGY